MKRNRKQSGYGPSILAGILFGAIGAIFRAARRS